MVYSGEEDKVLLEKYIAKIEKIGYEIEFVELTARPVDLINRVDDISRKKFQKLTDRTVMQDLVKDLSIFSIPFVNALKINTSELTPDQSAAYIVDQLDI